MFQGFALPFQVRNFYLKQTFFVLFSFSGWEGTRSEFQQKH
jgi:hypothetical protein